eukprot:PRCOL_00000929-RA
MRGCGVLGVGGAGCNAVNRMIDYGLSGVEYAAINTDIQALEESLAQSRVQIGVELTRGLGCGGSGEIGERAAVESEGLLRECVKDADLVVVTAGMGGGTGSGAAPVTARFAREAGTPLTLGVVTTPFAFEGRRRLVASEAAVSELSQYVDSLVVVPNNNLLGLVPENTPLKESFNVADDVLRQAVQAVTDIITVPGLVNVDFADVQAVMQNSGTAMLGMGEASGRSRAEDAAYAASNAPLLDQSIQSANGIVFNVTGGEDMTLSEINTVSEVVTSLADPSANIIFGAVVDPAMRGTLKVTIIATGFGMGQAGAGMGAESGAALPPFSIPTQESPLPASVVPPPLEQPQQQAAGKTFPWLR